MIIMTLKFIETHDACIFKHTSQRKLKPINTCNLRKIQVIKPIYSDKMIPYQLPVITLKSFWNFYPNLPVINRQK